ncbi:MAG: cellobiose phosphorylase, partial [Thermoleophilaceae bacterium]|nr:cellobiose phosphorylase [Thermoleophilaceae bacterium]
QVRYSDGSSGTLWDHLKLAFQHQELQLGPHGGYLTGATGDWSDFATQFLQMTESTLVSAQTAYVYPRLAELADARGDHAFAAALRGSGARDLATERREWTGKGWYSRGYSGERQIGSGAVFGEPQPWALLAGAPSASQAAKVVANVRRFLTGVGAPPEVHGPAQIGSSQSPASNDPDVTERSNPPRTIGGNGAVYVGGTWFAVNGWLTWALASLDGVVPHAADYALDEFARNTLAAHANAFPNHWDGILSVDDVCNSFHATDDPAKCGNGLSTSYEGQIMHQPAWSLYDATKLAGIQPTAAGYTFDPHLPSSRFSLRFPDVGVAYERRRARGYVVLDRAAAGAISVSVRVPAGVRASAAVTWVNGRKAAHTRRGGLLTFRLAPPHAGAAADWAVTRAPAVRRRVPRRPRPHRSRGHTHRAPDFTG